MKTSNLRGHHAMMVCCFILVASACPSVVHAQFVVEPHLQDVRQDGVTLLWALETSESGQVTIDGTLDFASAGPGEHHEVYLSGLDPATTYTYFVESGAATFSGTFTTAPSDALAPFRFVVLGDTRSGHDDHRAVIDAIIDEGPVELAIHTGDMVSSGEIQSDWITFFEIESPLISLTPWYPVVGNHEEDEGETPIWFTDYLAPPDETSGMEEYYSFTFANTAFVILDHHVNAEDRLFGLWTDFAADQLSWLEDTLDDYAADPTIQHIFVFVHEPPYSSKEGRTGSHAVRLIQPTLIDHGVDAVMTGHDHYLERGESPEGLPYFIIGGGGAPLYDNDSEGSLGAKFPSALPWFDDGHTVHFAASSHGFALVEIENGQVEVSIVSSSGTTIDEVRWNTGDIEGPVDPDAGPDGGVDSGPDGGLDGDIGDAGLEAGVDAGDGDSGIVVVDADATVDAAVIADAGTPDAGTPDAGTPDADRHIVDSGGAADARVGDTGGQPDTDDTSSSCSCRASIVRTSPSASALLSMIHLF